MNAQEQRTREQVILRIGAVGAVLGTILQVAAGMGYGSRPHDADAAKMLRWLADQPDWYWPAVYLSFILGALMWVGAFVALAGSLTERASGALGRLGLAAMLVGVALHAVDGSLSGGGLRIVADHWAAASGPEQAAVLEGTWASVISFFHGLPFILIGLAVALSRRYPAWLGWVGVGGGGGSLVVGMVMFATEDVVPDGLFIAGALVISLFMLILGVLMWVQLDEAGRAGQGAGA
jgi:hypothetical protein